jgi:hypothetical protein
MWRKILYAVLITVLVAILSISAFGLVYPDSFYNSISWTWYYNSPATSSYNCLGYATGSMTWEWPWGTVNPTLSQVTAYLGPKGYKTTGTWAYILAYGSSSSIAHFSKVTGTSWCRAKWGQLELFDHGSWDPYYATSVYGPLVQRYYY